jgi:cephalosporin-C deacetylase
MVKRILVSLFVLSLLLDCGAVAYADAPPTTAEIDHFWSQTLARLAKEPIDAREELSNEPVAYVKSKVTYRSLDGVRISAYLAHPYETNGKIRRRFPAIITGPGYRGDGTGIELSESLRGYVILHVAPRSQGDSAALWKIDGPDFLTWHMAHPEGYFYQGAYCDMVRGVDYLCSRDDVDPQRIGAMGISQGGGLVLAAAALDPRIKVVVARIPFLCNMRLAATIDGSLANTLLTRYHAMSAENLNTFDYFDPLNLARRIQAPTFMCAGGRDTTCPPGTIRPVFDNLAGVKMLAIYPKMDHPSGTDSHAVESFYEMGWDWMERYLKRIQQ